MERKKTLSKANSALPFTGQITGLSTFTMRLNEDGEPVLINYEFEITTPDAPERIFLLQKEHYREMNPSVRKPGSISFYRHAQLGSFLKGEYRRWEERSIYVVTSIHALGGNPTQGGDPKIMRNV